MEEDSKSSDEEQEQTVKYNPRYTVGGPVVGNHLPKRSSLGDGDDRPITPLRDKMIYDRVYSSLDFKDGKFGQCCKCAWVKKIVI